LWTVCVIIFHYSRTVQPLLLADNGEAPTNASRLTSLTLAEATKIWLYVHARWLCTEMNFGYLCNCYAGGWSLLFRVVYCTDKLPTIVCNVYCCGTARGKNCKVTWTDLVALMSFSLSTSHSLPQITFLWHKETIM